MTHPEEERRETVDEVDVRAAQYIVAHQCITSDPPTRGHCAWCDAFFVIEDMWNLLTPVDEEKQ